MATYIAPSPDELEKMPKVPYIPYGPKAQLGLPVPQNAFLNKMQFDQGPYDYENYRDYAKDILANRFSERPTTDQDMGLDMSILRKQKLNIWTKGRTTDKEPNQGLMFLGSFRNYGNGSDIKEKMVQQGQYRALEHMVPKFPKAGQGQIPDNVPVSIGQSPEHYNSELKYLETMRNGTHPMFYKQLVNTIQEAPPVLESMNKAGTIEKIGKEWSENNKTFITGMGQKNHDKAIPVIDTIIDKTKMNEIRENGRLVDQKIFNKTEINDLNETAYINKMRRQKRNLSIQIMKMLKEDGLPISEYDIQALGQRYLETDPGLIKRKVTSDKEEVVMFTELMYKNSKKNNGRLPIADLEFINDKKRSNLAFGLSMVIRDNIRPQDTARLINIVKSDRDLAPKFHDFLMQKKKNALSEKNIPMDLLFSEIVKYADVNMKAFINKGPEQGNIIRKLENKNLEWQKGPEMEKRGNKGNKLQNIEMKIGKTDISPATEMGSINVSLVPPSKERGTRFIIDRTKEEDPKNMKGHNA